MTIAEAVILPPFVAILAMGLATFACRIGGFLLMSRVRLTPRVERGFAAMPGALVAATVVPIVSGSGPAAAAAIVAAVATKLAVRNDLAALSVGVAVAAGARALTAG